jgi:hypothetical protein
MLAAKDFKTILLVTAGVFIAGYAMNALRDNSVVNDAINGFDA